MKILIVTTSNFSVELVAGEVLDLPPEWADRLLRGGQAVAATKPPKSEKPSPSHAPKRKNKG